MLGVFKRVGWGTVLCALLLTLSLQAQAQEKISEEAKIYFRNGVELLEQSPPNYQDAYYQFKLAYDNSKSWKVLGNLGLSALKLERDGEALEYYQKYLEQGGAGVDAEERSGIQRELVLVKGTLVQVQLSSDAPEVQVTDSRQGSSVPPQLYNLKGSLTIGVRAGPHVIIARAQGKEQRWEVSLAPGQTVVHEFNFNEVAPAPAPAAPVAATPAPAPVAPIGAEQNAAPSKGLSGLQIVGLVTAGVGVLAVGGGAVIGMGAKSSEDDARKQCIGDVCLEEAEEKFKSAESAAGLANIMLIGGGALVATGAVLFIVGGSGSSEKPPGTATWKVSLLLLPGTAGLFASGQF